MIRAHTILHNNTQPFLDSIENIYTLAGKQITAELDNKTIEDPLSIRNSRIAWIEYSKLTKELYDLIFAHAKGANEGGNWNFEINKLETLQFTRYDVGQYYNWHVDQNISTNEEICRKISFSILLNDDFEGGDLEIECFDPSHSERSPKVPLSKGDIVFFPSYTWHRVTPVTKGIRYSLVGWINGPQWR